MKKRKAFLYVFIGHNRTGKTVTAEKFARNYKKANPYNRIVAFDPQGRFKNIANELINEDKDFKQLADRKIKRTLIILDDYQHIVSEKPTKSFMHLLRQRSEWGIDFIIITHAPRYLRKQISYYFTHLFLFFTMGTNKDWTDRFDEPDIIIKAKEVIAGKWSNLSESQQENLYPNFPYIYIDVLRNKASLVNF